MVEQGEMTVWCDPKVSRHWARAFDKIVEKFCVDFRSGTFCESSSAIGRLRVCLTSSRLLATLFVDKISASSYGLFSFYRLT